jgi:hypothetical protein
LKITRHYSTSDYESTYHTDIVDVTIEAGKTISAFVDLKTSTWIEEGATHITTVYLVPINIAVRKKGAKVPANGVLALTTEAIEVGIDEGSLSNFNRFENQLAWDYRKFKNDGTFGSWHLLGFGSMCEATIGSGGIYQIRVTHLASNRVFFYLRRKDETITGVSYGPGRRGETDAIGICESQIQIDLCRESQKFYGSEKYSPWVVLPAQFGFPAFPNEGISIIRCNIFVAHRGCAAGTLIPKINGVFNEYPPLANEWAGIRDTSLLPGDPTYIQGWPILPASEDPQPGWIIAHPNSTDSGHCGIIDYDGEGVGSGSDSGTVNKNWDNRDLSG